MYIMDSSGDIVAQFGADGAHIGKTDGNYAFIDSDSFDIYHDNTQIMHVGYGEGNAQTGTSTAPYYTLGKRATTTSVYSSSETYSLWDHVLYNNKEYVCIYTISSPEEWYSPHWELAIGNRSLAEGSDTTACGRDTHAEGYQTLARGFAAHAEGEGSIAYGNFTHAEGDHTMAYNLTSHAEGDHAEAKGVGSHAEGHRTQANGMDSHTEGSYTKTDRNANGAHAEGYHAEANGQYSHAQNIYTIAASSAQTALGTFNIEDISSTTTHPNGYSNYGQYALIVGNGTSDSARSNALAVQWDGAVHI